MADAALSVLPRLLLRLGILAVAIWIGFQLGDAARDIAERFERADAARGMLTVLGLVAYALLLALPFAPGVEIGISILIMRGAEMAPYVYGATVAGLLLAYLAGRFLPLAFLRRLARDLRLRRVEEMLRGAEDVPPEERLARMRARLPAALGPVVCEWRYLTLAVLVNLPGNSILGGGGGILLMAGLSRLFSLPWILLTLALAVLPVPLAVWFIGTDILA